MSDTLDLVKEAYAMAVIEVARDDGEKLPSWNALAPGYRIAFIHMFTAARWDSETLGYKLKRPSAAVTPSPDTATENGRS